MTSIEAAANLPGFVRNLGAFQEIYWLYNKLGAHGFAYATEVEGPTTLVDWLVALDVLQQSPPFFLVALERYGGGVPFFRHVRGAPIPRRLVNGASGASWRAEMAREVFTPFCGGICRRGQRGR